MNFSRHSCENCHLVKSGLHVLSTSIKFSRDSRSCSLGGKMHKTYWSTALTIFCLGFTATSSFAGDTYNKYDELGRLVLTSYPNGSQVGYHYDATGNRDEVRRIQIIPPATQNTLEQGRGLILQAALKSTNGSYTLVLQEDGNLVLLNGGTPLWHTQTNAKISAHLVMQSDGNLVIYGPASEVIWHAGTHGNNGAKLVLQDDGKLVIYSASNAVLWQKP